MIYCYLCLLVHTSAQLLFLHFFFYLQTTSSIFCLICSATSRLEKSLIFFQQWFPEVCFLSMWCFYFFNKYHHDYNENTVSYSVQAEFLLCVPVSIHQQGKIELNNNFIRGSVDFIKWYINFLKDQQRNKNTVPSWWNGSNESKRPFLPSSQFH